MEFQRNLWAVPTYINVVQYDVLEAMTRVYRKTENSTSFLTPRLALHIPKSTISGCRNFYPHSTSAQQKAKCLTPPPFLQSLR